MNSPMDWALRPLKHYADFEGRSPRSEYWWFTLFQWLVYVVLCVLFFVGAAGSGPAGPGAFSWVVFAVGMLFLMAMFIPNLAMFVRRLHDQDLSGWFILLSFIPYIGGIIAIVFICIRGTNGPNRFGSDPFGGERHLEQVFA